MDEVNAPSRRWTQRRDSPRAAQAESTRTALVAAARELFAEHGFHAVGVRDVTARAGLSRGALSHHFADKTALFIAVFEAVENDLVAESQAWRSDAAAMDAWTEFRSGVQVYLEAAAARRDVQRITLIDGPAVLGWGRWRKLEEGLSLGMLTAVLQAAMEAGRIGPRPVEPLAHLILGSVMEAALLVANSDDPQQRRHDVGQALDALLGGLE